MSKEPVRIKVDFDAWTMGDHEDFEEYVGAPYEEAFAPKPLKDQDGRPLLDDRNRPLKGVKLTLKVQTATIFIEKRHEDPTFTLEQARALPRALVDFDFGTEPDPKAPPVKRAARKRTASSQPSATSTT